MSDHKYVEPKIKKKKLLSDKQNRKRKQPDHEWEVRRAKFLHMLNNPKHCSECLGRYGFMMCQFTHPDESIRSDVK
jgi:hypothetical protein